MPHRTIVDPRLPARLRDLRTERGLSLKGLSQASYVSKSHISEIENGVKTPGAGTARALDAALHANGELASMVSEPERPDGIEANGPSHEDSADELRERLLNAAAVDARATALLAEQANAIREIDRRLGARTAGPQALGHVRALNELRAFSLALNQREALACLYADGCALLGWQYLDRGELGKAWQYHEEAKDAAREGVSPAALAHSMAEQAYILHELDEPAVALELAESARMAAGTAVPPLMLSWLWAVCSELHAALGNERDCLRGFDAAEDLLPTQTSDPALPYIFLSEVHLARWRGHARARLGDSAAAEELQRALEGLDPSFTRARAGLHVDLAHAYAAARYNDDAQAHLRKATTLAARVGSVRQQRRVRRLESVLHVP